MKALASTYYGQEFLGDYSFEVGKKTKLKEVERSVSRGFGGEEFRKITLIEDFMRMVFSSDLTVPVKICPEAGVLPSVNLHGCVRMYFLFERGEVHFDLRLGSLEEEGEKEKIKEKIKERFLNSGHYLGTFFMPCSLTIEKQTDFVNRQSGLIDASDIPDRIGIKAVMKRRKYSAEYDKKENFLNVFSDVVEGLEFDSDVYFRVFKGDRDKCLLSIEFPPHSVVKGFSSVSLGEVVKLFGKDFSIDYDMDRIVNVEVI